MLGPGPFSKAENRFFIGKSDFDHFGEFLFLFDQIFIDFSQIFVDF